MVIRNFTGHQINIYDPTGKQEIIRFESEGMARVNTVREYGVIVSGKNCDALVPANEIISREISGLPDPEHGVLYIVTNMVFDSSRRFDLLCPDELVRDASRRVKGCTSLRRRSFSDR